MILRLFSLFRVLRIRNADYSSENDVYISDSYFLELSGGEGAGVLCKNTNCNFIIERSFFFMCSSTQSSGGMLAAVLNSSMSSCCFYKCVAVDQSDAFMCSATFSVADMISVSMCPSTNAYSKSNSVGFTSSTASIKSFNSSDNKQNSHGQCITTQTTSSFILRYFTFIRGDSVNGAAFNIHESATTYKFEYGVIANMTPRTSFGLVWTNTNCKNCLLTECQFKSIYGSIGLTKAGSTASLAKYISCSFENSALGGASTLSCVFGSISKTRYITHLKSWECQNDQIVPSSMHNNIPKQVFFLFLLFSYCS